MQQTLEATLAQYCAPSLAGIKSADLISWGKERTADFLGVVAEYNRRLNPSGIYFRVICGCRRRWLLLVYRENRLAETLAQPDVAFYLARKGYPAGDGLEAMLEHLELRLATAPEFPHEIGLFLGYPLTDVVEFCRQKGENHLCCGLWKVYSNVEAAQALFARYRKCTRAVQQRVAQGCSIVSLFCPASRSAAG